MNIAIVGTGYVGLVSGTCFAEMGVDVTCVDVNEQKIQALQAGEVPIYEPGLDEMVLRNQREGRLHFTTDLTTCLDNVEVVFSAVGTPPDEDGSADLSYVLEVARTVGKNLNHYVVLVTKSDSTGRNGEVGESCDSGRTGQARRAGGIRCGLESGIPEGRCRH